MNIVYSGDGPVGRESIAVVSPLFPLTEHVAARSTWNDKSVAPLPQMDVKLFRVYYSRISLGRLCASASKFRATVDILYLKAASRSEGKAALRYLRRYCALSRYGSIDFLSHGAYASAPRARSPRVVIIECGDDKNPAPGRQPPIAAGISPSIWSCEPSNQRANLSPDHDTSGRSDGRAKWRRAHPRRLFR